MNATAENLNTAPVHTAHLILQGKGGVGKSFIAALIAQYLRSQGRTMACIDTDPVNSTFAGYTDFKVDRIELMDGGTLNERKFDDVIERVVSEDSDFVIDNGSASFIPLSNYLVENDAINVLTKNGKRVVIHTVVTGGQAILDTLAGFKSLASQLPENVELVVWLNEFFGEIEADGKQFEQMKVYDQHRDRVSGIVRIYRQTGSTFGKDVQLMLDKKMTFDQVAKSETFGLMAKQRLSTVKRAIFEQLSTVL